MEPRQKTADIRFYEELNDFLPGDKRKKTLHYSFWGNPAVKDVIEALGVPHSEVDLILVNGQSVRFNYHICAGDLVSVYPVFERFDITSVTRLRLKPLRRIKFILDVHLGRLAHLLRMLGFDCLYRKDFGDEEIRSIALKEKRIILTRDQNLLKVKTVTHGYWLRSTEPLEQMVEVIRRFDLKSACKPFCRCLVCNGLIKKVNKHKIKDLIPDRVFNYYQEFFQCRSCTKLYWQGTHYQKMKEKISKIYPG
jgi:uncharacterized protein